MSRYVWAEPPSQTAFPIARPGLPFIGAASFITAVFALLGMQWPALAGLVATLCICAFFRDPDRVIPADEGAVVAPADGKVIVCRKVASSDYYDGECLQISIFMTVFNVHVNRMVFDGTITDVNYHPGKFFSANLDKASRENEHNALTLEGAGGQRLVVVQIAGLVARRIVCGVQVGATLLRGERFGMICFGSRLDVYLPPETETAVTVGDKVVAGTSTLGYLK
ncbi:MAG: phosphatidylserine decarboxylase family protein [Desulfobacterales bacterium]|jgi:phosphatidylserine decarboxylase